MQHTFDPRSNRSRGASRGVGPTCARLGRRFSAAVRVAALLGGVTRVAALLGVAILGVAWADDDRRRPAGDEPVDARAAARVASAREAAARPFAFLADARAVERLEADFAELREAQELADEWLNDPSVYPIPAKAYTGWVAGSDVQPGHDEMERRVSTALAAHNAVIARLGRHLGLRPIGIGSNRPTTGPVRLPAPKVAVYGIRALDVAKLLERAASRIDAYLTVRDAVYGPPQREGRLRLRQIGERSRRRTEDEGGAPVPAEGPSDAFLEAVAALAEPDVEAIEKALLEVERDSLERVVFAYLAAYRQMAWNEAHPNGHEKLEVEGVRLVNAYRIALGRPPLACHPLAHAMASDHAEQMRIHGFMGHVHPNDPERRAPEDRARRIGYETMLGENCSSVGAGETNIWRWRADAGHHRTLIDPFATEIGLAVQSDSVLNTGNGRQLGLSAIWRSLDLP